jgi:hypothetical protein
MEWENVEVKKMETMVYGISERTVGHILFKSVYLLVVVKGKNSSFNVYS